MARPTEHFSQWAHSNRGERSYEITDRWLLSSHLSGEKEAMKLGALFVLFVLSLILAVRLSA